MPEPKGLSNYDTKSKTNKKIFQVDGIFLENPLTGKKKIYPKINKSRM